MATCKSQHSTPLLFPCRERHCEFCFWRESRRARKQYMLRFIDCVDCGLRVAILTLTIPNVATINSEVYDLLFERLKELLNLDYVRRYIYGGVAKVETTYNANRLEFHPHIHILIVYKACIPQKRIKALWGTLTADLENYEISDFPASTASSRSVWIKRIKFDSSKPASVRKAIRDGLNYLCKFNPINDPGAFASLYCATKGKRLIRAYGGLRKGFRNSFNQ
jgi:Replication protein